ncbi:interleukin-23 receptor [Nothobranchius furzeri]|uniref:Interleukin-12 receptor subunit beta-2-like n=2 Tax=Nothobranchius furzeri TaxID=105023 RepID=A0A8C6NS69_NOTFU|nr:interleukin-12 receptor subunit beta-2-like [Nothobranchius furzeri]
MTLFQTTWRCMIMFLTLFIQSSSQFSADVLSLGNLTVEPPSPFLLGSNLIVYCHLNECDKNFRYTISLYVNGSKVNGSKRINCTTEKFFLPRMSQSLVVCMKKHHQLPASMVVHGEFLLAGLPPDKPTKIGCETTRSSDQITCSWARGQETYLDTVYNVSLSSENGTRITSDHIQNSNQITIHQKITNENTKYRLIIMASNHFEASQSDPFIFCMKDIVMPEIPHIVKLDFGNNSRSGVLHWNTSESSEDLRPEVKLRVKNGSWELREGPLLGDGLLQVDNLRPLTEYELQIRTCYSPTFLKSSFKTTRTSRSFCSKWSSPVREMSPGKGPTRQLRVWRVLADQEPGGLRKVLVLWKPPPPEDYRSDFLQIQVRLDDGREEICPAASRQCEVQVPTELHTLSVSAVTSFGTSPTANVELRHAGVLGPSLLDLTPTANGSSVLVYWSRTFGGELLHYVIEWMSVPAGGLQWKRLAGDLRNASIPGLTAGVRYKISLYAVTTRGVSSPTSSLFYSKEERPISGPTPVVRAHGSRRILIQWDELPVDQQRGFITNYTIYLQTLDFSSTESSVTVSVSGPGEAWLDCPEGALTLQLTASNSAGEGPRGELISSQPAAPAVALVIGIVFTFTIFMVVVLLMCWSCVRKWIKQKCVSWGPKWLVEKPPKPGHSTAIRLLEDNRGEPLLSSTYSDPPLSPILVISQEERDEVYSTIQVEESQSESGQAVTEASLSESDTRMTMVEHASYKPQICTLFPIEKEKKDAEEEMRDVSSKAGEDGHLGIFDELLEGLVPNVNMDYSGSSQGMTIGSVNGLMWPKNAETILLNSLFFKEWKNKEEAPSLNLQQDDEMTSDTNDHRSSLCLGETEVNSDYFPQVACLHAATSDTQR